MRASEKVVASIDELLEATKDSTVKRIIIHDELRDSPLIRLSRG